MEAMEKRAAITAVFIAAMLLMSGNGYAHSEEAARFYFFDAFLYGIAALIVLSLLAVHYREHMTKTEKKVVFVLYILITAGITIYIAGGTAYLNMTSATGGPIHWHADFEVWACGQKLEMQHSEGLENKVGTNLMHAHDDYRIHVEGVLQHMDEASVGEFFEAIGGEFSEDTLTVPLLDTSMRTWKNGDLCPDGNPGKIRFFINGKENFDFGKYIIAPYADVPPGDFLNITFSTT